MNEIYAHWTRSNSEHEGNVLWELMDACKLVAGYIPDDKNELKLIPSNLTMMTTMRGILSEFIRDKPFDVIRVKSIFHAKYKKNYINYVNAVTFIEWATSKNYKIPSGILSALISANIVFKGDCAEILYNQRAIDWAYWMSMKTLSAKQASLLMFSLDPEIYDNPDLNIKAIYATTDPVRKSKKVELLSLNHLKDAMTPSEWVTWAQAQYINISSNFKPYNSHTISNKVSIDSALVEDPLEKNTPQHEKSEDLLSEIEALFDPVSAAALEKMFPSKNMWMSYKDHAKKNGLIEARVDRGKFNPCKAASWWLEVKKPVGWDMARCMRTLANNLPPRSLDKKYLLTGEF